MGDHAVGLGSDVGPELNYASGYFTDTIYTNNVLSFYNPCRAD